MKSFRLSYILNTILGTSLILLSLCLSGCKTNSSTVSDSEVVVTTNYGKLKGSLVDNVGIFKGIPYAAPSDGDNRFLPPTPLQKWEGILETKEWGPKSFQLPMNLPPEALKQMKLDEGRANEMDENCQSINIWSPSIKSDKKLPVMFWCHGGGFVSGSGSGSVFDGYNMAKSGDVVIVSVTHRLGALGFLYLGHIDKKYESSGNVGMLDIVAALKWVSENIEQFGGDPNNVTIFGQSGGGGKVSTLMAMPAADGLFHKAIVQSGALINGVLKEDAIARTNALFDALGISQGNIDSLLKVDPMVLVEKSSAMQNGDMSSAPSGRRMGFAPVVDGVTLLNDPFNPDAPEQSSEIPLIIGTNKDEMGMPLNDENEIINAMKQQVGGDVDELLAAYKEEFPDYSLPEIYSLFSADIMMRINSITMAERKLKQTAPVYMYLFNYGITTEGSQIPKSGHSMEISFVFNNPESPIVPGVPVNDGTISLAGKMSKAWTSFAHNGNPNHNGLPEWPIYNVTDRSTMLFDTECFVQNNPSGEIINFLMKKKN